MSQQLDIVQCDERSFKDCMGEYMWDNQSQAIGSHHLRGLPTSVRLAITKPFVEKGWPNFPICRTSM